MVVGVLRWGSRGIKRMFTLLEKKNLWSALSSGRHNYYILLGSILASSQEGPDITRAELELHVTTSLLPRLPTMRQWHCLPPISTEHPAARQQGRGALSVQTDGIKVNFVQAKQSWQTNQPYPSFIFLLKVSKYFHFGGNRLSVSLCVYKDKYENSRNRMKSSTRFLSLEDILKETARPFLF